MVKYKWCMYEHVLFFPMITKSLYLVVLIRRDNGLENAFANRL